MLSVAEAQAKLLGQLKPLPAQARHLSPLALNLVLAENVASDLDMPPFDKAMMDGYAVRSADFSAETTELTVVEEVTAGQVPQESVGPGQATRIMTGAPMPAGANAVVMVERTKMTSAATVVINDKTPKPGQHVLYRGREMRRGEAIMTKGMRLRPQELGLLATLGRTSALLQPAPRLAVLSTGDELVEAPAQPGPGQIRNGNGPMLMSQAARVGAEGRYLGVAGDRRENLLALIAEGLKADILVLSGGVSAGKMDLVPSVLAELGVEELFHRVHMKPGKPIYAGLYASPAGQKAVVLGLPGNPVSAFVGFELFVRPAVRALMGHAPLPNLVQALLAEDFALRTDRPTYHPAWLVMNQGTLTARPATWSGSSDLRGLSAANGFIVFPAGEHLHKAGTLFDVLTLDFDPSSSPLPLGGRK